MSETFLSRWSRRKREASIPPSHEGGEDRRSEPGGASHREASPGRLRRPRSSFAGGMMTWRRVM